ncbi:MAG TPA: NAD-dependent protein deacylase [Haloplasmataceae bacterium]
MNHIELLKKNIKDANNIVVMTGAGISVPSGIPDFRSASGLYNEKYKTNISPEEILSHHFFLSNPEAFYDFYRNKMIYIDAKPNIAHKTLAKLEDLGKLKMIITQNIDGLHSLAGNKNVIELHGSIHRNYCMKCHKSYSLTEILDKDLVPTCSCGGIIKPDVVLYEEALPSKAIEDAVKAVEKADLLIVVGTSLLVSPANYLVHYFRGSNLVIINKSTTPYDRYASLLIREPLETVLTNDLIEELR